MHKCMHCVNTSASTLGCQYTQALRLRINTGALTDLGHEPRLFLIPITCPMNQIGQYESDIDEWDRLVASNCSYHCNIRSSNKRHVTRDRWALGNNYQDKALHTKIV